MGVVGAEPAEQRFAESLTESHLCTILEYLVSTQINCVALFSQCRIRHPRRSFARASRETGSLLFPFPLGNVH